jgi:plastocyanin
MRAFVTAGVLIGIGVGMLGCGGSGYPTGSGSPGSPTPPAGSDVVVINVVAINGAQSFSPNPATVPAGQMVVWHNVDNVTHHVLLNDRSIDTGDLAPGTFSAQMPLTTPGPYHCTIHPEMVGTVTR